MKILFIAHRIPYPPNKGEKIRAFHQIRCLSMKHSVHLACLADEKEDLHHIKKLEKYCASVEVVYRDKTSAKFRAVMALFTNKPLSVASFYSRELKNRVLKRLALEEFDAIFVFSSAMAEFVKHLIGTHRVMDFVDVDSEKWRAYADHHAFPLSWIYRLEAKRLARYEENIARVYEHSIFVSDKEADIFRSRVGDRPISVISNGVDTDYFCPSGANSTNTDQPAVIFIGAMNYFPNVDAVTHFCEKIFPIIRRSLPETMFYIVGHNPTHQVRTLSRQTNVIVTGSISDVRHYLEKARVAVAPFRISRGIQNKILEAMAMGVPVVGTSLAFQGIKASPADGIRIADDCERFAQEAIIFLKDNALRNQCGLQARDYVLKNHRWQEQVAGIEPLLQKAIRGEASNP